MELYCIRSVKGPTTTEAHLGIRELDRNKVIRATLARCFHFVEWTAAYNAAFTQ